MRLLFIFAALACSSLQMEVEDDISPNFAHIRKQIGEGREGKRRSFYGNPTKKLTERKFKHPHEKIVKASDFLEKQRGRRARRIRSFLEIHSEVDEFLDVALEAEGAPAKSKASKASTASSATAAAAGTPVGSSSAPSRDQSTLVPGKQGVPRYGMDILKPSLLAKVDSYFSKYPKCRIPLDLTSSQGECNSCYAHAAATQLAHYQCAYESDYADGVRLNDEGRPLHPPAFAPNGRTGKFSVQQIIDCGPGAGCSEGGNAIDVISWVHSNFLNPRSCNHPGGYVADKLVSPTNPKGSNPTCDVFECEGAVANSTMGILVDYTFDLNTWKSAIWPNTIVATMNLYNDFEQFNNLPPRKSLKLGVYTCPPGVQPTGNSHWIVIVGWGTADDLKLDFFIAENSWGNIYGNFDGGFHNPVDGLGPYVRLTQDPCLGWGNNGNIWGLGSIETAVKGLVMKPFTDTSVTSLKTKQDVIARSVISKEAQQDILPRIEDVRASLDPSLNHQISGDVYSIGGSTSSRLPGGG